MTTKQQQQQHVSRFLEASLLRQAEGKLKKSFIKIAINLLCLLRGGEKKTSRTN